MRKISIKILSAGAVCASLLTVFLTFLVRLTSIAVWSQLSTLELVIFSTMILRVLLVLALARAIKVQPLYAVVLLSLEVFIIPFLALASLLTGDRVYTVWLADVLTTWLAAASIVLSPLAIYELVAGMAKATSLAGTLVIGTLEMGGLLFLSETISSISSKIKGLSVLGALIVQGNPQIASPTIGDNSEIAMLVSIIVFSVGMLIYFTLGTRATPTQIKVSDTLLLVLGGVIITILWAFFIMIVSADVLLVFTVPTVICAAILWGMTFER